MKLMCFKVVVPMLLSLLVMVSAKGQSLPSSFSKDSRGAIRVMDIRMYPVHYNPKWYSAAYTFDSNFNNMDNVALDGWQFTSQLQTKDDFQFVLKNKVVSNDKDKAITWHIDASSTKPVPTRMLALSIDLPVSRFAGMQLKVQHRTVTLPAQQQENPLILSGAREVRLIQIPTPQGPIHLQGFWDVEILDRRKWKTNAYTMRLYFKENRGMVTQSSFDIRVAAGQYQCFPLDIADQCNMGFKDEVADDKQGGWTDQGPGNDLSALKSGMYDFGGIKMNVIDPAQNRGKSSMVFGFDKRPFDLKQTRIQLPADQRASQARTLFVMHSAAWAKSLTPDQPIGIIHVSFKDGSTLDIPVRSGKDLGDWWNPSDKVNGRVVWSAPNGRSLVGVYLSRYELPAGKSLEQLEIQTNNRCVWGVLAMTLCSEDAPLPSVEQTPLTIAAGKDWKPINWTQEVEPGSILDLSTQYPQQEAGKWGRVLVRGRHFEFENRPGVPVRFHGVNLGFDSCFMPHEGSQRLARQLQSMGYNIARLHHFDRSILDANGPNSHTINKDQADRFFYLIAQLKKHGIYVTWDLYSYRGFRAEDSQLNRDYFREIKSLILVDEKARKALTDFAQVLLTQTNPYTGLSLADDPVLATTSTMNEDFLIPHWNKYPDVAQLIRKAYADWVKVNAPQADPDRVGTALFTKFMYETATETHRSLQQSLKQMDVKTPFTANNYDRLLAANGLYDAFGYVDNHFYHDHPAFVNRQWSLPYSFSCASSVRQMTSSLRLQFPVRRLDKPFSITEYSYVMPNPYRAEGGALVGSYAAFQDWDMLCRFYWGGGKINLVTKPGYMEGFSVVNDPIALMSERLINLLFRRADVAKAKKTVAYVVDPEHVFVEGKDLATHPDAYSQVGLITGTGTVTRSQLSTQLPDDTAALCGDQALADDIHSTLPFVDQQSDILDALAKQNVVAQTLIDRAKGRYTSDTGEIQLATKEGRFHVQTPNTEAIVLADKGSYSGERLVLENVSGPVTVSVSAMDDKPLESSGRILLMHLTNVLNNQMKFRDQHGRVLEAWGTLPLMVKKGTATISLSLDNPADMKVFAVDLSGKRIAEISTSTQDGKHLTFTVDTHANEDDGVLAYEMIRQ